MLRRETASGTKVAAASSTRIAATTPLTNMNVANVGGSDWNSVKASQTIPTARRIQPARWYPNGFHQRPRRSAGVAACDSRVKKLDTVASKAICGVAGELVRHRYRYSSR